MVNDVTKKARSNDLAFFVWGSSGIGKLVYGAEYLNDLVVLQPITRIIYEFAINSTSPYPE